VSNTIAVPAREARAVTVPAGVAFRVIDVEGVQVADVFAFNARDVSEYHSAMHTRAVTERLFPRVGQKFVTNLRRPILVLERDDDTPSMHDMLIAPCDPQRYVGLDVDGWHASCTENLRSAMAELGHEEIVVPQPINLFMNIPVGDGGTLTWKPAETRPGDSVTFRAAMDVIVVVSACPQDIVPINDGKPTSLAIEVFSESAATPRVASLET
jgi:uncharacterized protein